MRIPALASLALIAAMVAGPALAAQQGNMGAASRGEISIRLSVAPRVRLSIGEAAPVQAAAAGPPGSEVRRACLWSNTPTRGFRLTAPGAAAQDALLAAVQPHPGCAAAAQDALLAAVQPHPGCAAAGGTSARLIVPMPQARLQRAAMTGAPGAPIVLLVVPE